MALLNEHNETALPGIFEMYCAGRQTARLTVNYPDGEGVFFFEKGELIEAQLGELNGMEAVDQALRLQEEGFRVDLDVAVPPRTIFGEWGSLLPENNRQQNGDHHLATDKAATDPVTSDQIDYLILSLTESFSTTNPSTSKLMSLYTNREPGGFTGFCAMAIANAVSRPDHGA